MKNKQGGAFGVGVVVLFAVVCAVVVFAKPTEFLQSGRDLLGSVKKIVPQSDSKPEVPTGTEDAVPVPQETQNLPSADTATQSDKIPVEPEETSLASSESAQNSTPSTENTDPPDTQQTEMGETDPEVTDHTLKLGTEYVKSLARGTADTFWFSTTSNMAVYRVLVNTDVSDTPFDGSLKFSVYDSRGIEIISKQVSYLSMEFVDLTLEPNSQYQIKITGTSDRNMGNYTVCVSERIAQGGLTKEQAVVIDPLQEQTFMINSTYSNWYTATFAVGGQYRITVHNIDVGCRAEVSGYNKKTNGSMFSVAAANEDNRYSTFSVLDGEAVYLEVKPWPMDLAANGTVIVIIEKLN